MKSLFKTLMFVACVMSAAIASAQESTSGYKQLSETKMVDEAQEQFELGMSYANDYDYEEAIVCFRKAAEMGNAEAQSELGACYYNGEGVDQDYDEALKWFTLSAEQGYAMAQYNLGLCYYWGLGVEYNLNIAIKWFRKAAAQKNENAIEALDILKCYSI